ncbi:MAG TPA: GIY-YIG nuclease family protein [Microbacterium sp.]|nr:GIY-YIG nuclease family protein [Microbacterium sp.]
MPYMYIVRCRDGAYYTGSTLKDPEARVWEHNNDEDLAARFTIKRRPVVLVHVESFTRIDDAFAREKQVQRWSRAKKDALIDGRLGDLPGLARSRRNDASPGAGDRCAEQSTPRIAP